MPGVLPAVLAAGAEATHVVVPESHAGKARLVPGVSVLGVRSLRQVLAVLRDLNSRLCPWTAPFGIFHPDLTRMVRSSWIARPPTIARSLPCRRRSASAWLT